MVGSWMLDVQAIDVRMLGSHLAWESAFHQLQEDASWSLPFLLHHKYVSIYTVCIDIYIYIYMCICGFCFFYLVSLISISPSIPLLSSLLKPIRETQIQHPAAAFEVPNTQDETHKESTRRHKPLENLVVCFGLVDVPLEVRINGLITYTYNL